jgi:hypothetical protein
MVTGFAEKRFASQDMAQELSGIRAVAGCLWWRPLCRIHRRHPHVS